MDEWQPIVTAPRDGREVCVLAAADGPWIARWRDGPGEGWEIKKAAGRDPIPLYIRTPLGWMPMPSADLPWVAGPDAITELLNLRAWVLSMADLVEAIGELPARQRGPEAQRLAERMRHVVSAQHVVDACKR